MKILHTSDWHVGRSIRGRSRADEHKAVLDEIIRIAASNEVDVVLVAGDLFDTGAPSPESESIVFRALLDLARIAPVVAVAGNHDNARRFTALEPLLGLGRISIRSGVRRPEEGGVIDVPGVDCRVAMVPWTSQRGIVKADDLMSLDPDDHGL
ncbi:MAG TPA: exonuclease subunit SbcD, partial [Acidimicrobiia bacterium]